MVFKRTLEDYIRSLLFKGKAILIFGPRQAGKTTLAKQLLEAHGDRGLYLNCELAHVRSHLILGQPEKLRELIGNKHLIVLDEAQTILNIGSILKVFLDTYTDVQIIATGSSSFDLANKINEPLTGRAFEFTLYPLSLSEIFETSKPVRGAFLELLRTGMYPEIASAESTLVKESILRNITTNYLYKDVFVFESIRNPFIFEKLIKMLAFQIGQMVSVNELAQGIGTSRTSVEKYLKLLEQAYIIKRVNTFSRNGRNELKKAFKVYFLDLGIRNAVIDSLGEIEARNDKGNLFENFVFLELLKSHAYEAFPPQISFWRTETKQEIDFVLYKNEHIEAIETKWKSNSISFKNFLRRYPEAKTRIIQVSDFVKA